jgi:hypothetical protein
MRIIDVTRPVFAGMPVWPGDPPCHCRWSARLPGDGYNAAELSFGAHTSSGPCAVLALPAGPRLPRGRETFTGLPCNPIPFMPRILPILPLLLAIPLRAAAQDGLESRNEAFLRAVKDASLDSVAAFFPRRGDWTWTQVTHGAPFGRRSGVWRFAATETLRAIGDPGPVCESFWQPGDVGPAETVLVMRIILGGTRWRRVAGNRFVPPGESARSPVFVQWRREDGRWVVSAFGDATYWFPPVLGYVRSEVERDTVLRLPPTPVYAAEAPWYLDSRTIHFEGYRYTKYGLPRAIADTLSLRRVGRFGLIGVYTEKRSTTAELLYIPLAPGQYQLYEVQHGRGSHCR